MKRVVEHTCEAVIFDLDGVLVDSQDAVVAAWEAWRRRVRLPPEALDVGVFTGRRSGDVIADLAPDLDCAAELAFFQAQEQLFAHRVRSIRGASELVARLPRDRWAIATSGAATVALGRLAVVGLPVPAVLVTAESVTHGKPHPEPYLLASRKLGRAPAACVVFEDAAIGIAAARAAGCFAVGVATCVTPETLEADVVVEDFRAVDVALTTSRLALRIRSLV